MFTIPKSITNHKSVLECLDGKAEGFDYKYDVWLKPNWSFSLGRMEGLRGGRFNTVVEFMQAKPVRGK